MSSWYTWFLNYEKRCEQFLNMLFQSHLSLIPKGYGYWLYQSLCYLSIWFPWPKVWCCGLNKYIDLTWAMFSPAGYKATCINGSAYLNWTHTALLRETWHLSQAHIFTLMLILLQKGSHLLPSVKSKSTFKWTHCRQYSPGKASKHKPCCNLTGNKLW